MAREARPRVGDLVTLRGSAIKFRVHAVRGWLDVIKQMPDAEVRAFVARAEEIYGSEWQSRWYSVQTWRGPKMEWFDAVDVLDIERGGHEG